MPFLSFDLESYRFGPGNMAPKPVCLSWAVDQESDLVVGLDNIAAWMDEALDVTLAGHVTLVGHSVSYDFACLLQHAPSLADKIWRAYWQGCVTCTSVREKLLDIAIGEFGEGLIDGEIHKKGYSLADITQRRLGITLDKSADGWRTRYAELDGLPKDRWPQEAIDYAMMDARATLLIAYAQDIDAQKIAYSLPTQYLETCADLGLRLTTNWGLVTDPVQVTKVWNETCFVLHSHLNELRDLKLLKPKNGKAISFKLDEVPDFSKDLKLLRQLISQHYPDGNPPRTPPSAKYPEGQIKTGTEIVEECDYPPLVKLAEFDHLRKMANTYLSKLKEPIVHPSYQAIGAVTTRTSSFDPNIQNNPRKAGVRECFVPRSGHVFLACDYDAQEMRTLAQNCIDICGRSLLAERFREDPHFDPHLEFAARSNNISLEEAKRLKKTDDPKIKDLRQRAKAANFGFPGGMGAAKFVKYAKNYGVTFTIDEAQQIRKDWLVCWPEVVDYFAHASNLVGMAGMGTQTYPRSGVRRDGIGYCDGANGYFQGLAAHASKSALFEVARQCYNDPESWLYGSRPVAFIHDEIILETPEEVGHEAAQTLEKVMIEQMQKWTPDVPAAASATLMRYWSKDAKRVFDKNGRLIPWEGKK